MMASRSRAASAPSRSGRARAGVVLLAEAVNPRTFKTYADAVASFKSWIGPELVATVYSSEQAMSTAAEMYVQHLFDNGAPKSHASAMVCGVSYFTPLFSAALKVARKQLVGWSKFEPSKQRPPMPAVLVYIIAYIWAQRGHLDRAVAILLAFDAYLRVSELVSIRLQHISLPKDEGAEVQGAFALERTKTGENQSVRLRKGATTTLLRALVTHRLREGGDKLFTFTTGHFRKWIKAECTSLGLGDIGFTPHSLRHGGATADFLRGMSVNDIQFRGRWRCFESLRRYLQQCESLFLQQRLPQVLQDLAACLNMDMNPGALPPASFAPLVLGAVSARVASTAPRGRAGGLPPLAPGTRGRARSLRAVPRA